MRRELVVCGRELQSARPFRGGSFVDDMLRLLAKLTCRIAVIGQVKAGKSTFINGLVRSPGLLPTDVNPWTTAVTHLHFARADAPPNIAAEFTFFELERTAGAPAPDPASGSWLRARAAPEARRRDAASLRGAPRLHPAHAARQEARIPLHHHRGARKVRLLQPPPHGDGAQGRLFRRGQVGRSLFLQQRLRLSHHHHRHARHQRPVPGARRDDPPRPGECRYLHRRAHRAAGALVRGRGAATHPARAPQGAHLRLHQPHRRAWRSGARGSGDREARPERLGPRVSELREFPSWRAARCGRRSPSAAAARRPTAR